MSAERPGPPGPATKENPMNIRQLISNGDDDDTTTTIPLDEV
ncbi:hypothetical protein [Streptomyces sp. NBC_01022]|nr:hypothetical protein [Streptomyces sp. NBC_01022]WRZ84829.1 hypothetical protein OG316_33500 [Streptomyces sp. NBC_01022]